MKEQLANKQVDEIGAKMLRSVYLSEEKIDEIVGAPGLFKQVSAAIANERMAPSFTPIRTGWVVSWSWQMTGAAVAVTIVAAVITTLLVFGLGNKINSPDRTVNPPLQQGPVEPGIVLANDEDNPVVLPERGNQAALRKPALISRNKSRHTPAYTHDDGEPGEYYAIAYGSGQDDGDDDDDGQRVRVEMPRSALFALGVDIPVENENSKVKADIVMGADGVIKGVRIIK
jgi:hypothetical protein